MKIAVVGSGASAVITVIKLLKKGHLDITWYGGRYFFEIPQVVKPLGIAYGQCRHFHLLNVEAEKMSPFPDEMGFDTFASIQKGFPGVQHKTFFPRQYFARYLSYLIERSKIFGRIKLREALEPGSTNVLGYDSVILCLGVTSKNKNPSQDPWAYPYRILKSSALRPFNILGSGLTALDVATSVWDSRPELHVSFNSRHGLLPAVWTDTPASNFELKPFKTCRDIIQQIRYHLPEGDKTEAMTGVFKSLRSKWNAIWAQLSEKERLRFTSKILPFYSVFRHRLVPATASLLSKHSYSVEKISSHRKPMDVLAVGISTNPNDNQLLVDLRSRGLLDFAPSNLGLKADLLGKVSDKFYCVGAYMKDVRFESTSIPDIIQMSDNVVNQFS